MSGHFGVEYTRKVLIDKGVVSEGLRRAITKFVRDCPVCQLRSVLNRQILALLSHVCRYGMPMTIRSDRGTQFVNAIISQLLSLLQIEHELSLAYSKEHNAIVERANKEVMRHLTAIIFDKRVNTAWSGEYCVLQALIHAGSTPRFILIQNIYSRYLGI